MAKKATSSPKWGAFNVQAFLDSAGVARTIVEFQTKNTLFSQGDLCNDVMYIQTGSVKLSVVSKTGKEAEVAMLTPGDFVGEGALARQLLRLTTATAVMPTSVLVIGLQEMKRMLHEEHAFSDRFISHLLECNTKVEEDLVDQLFNRHENPCMFPCYRGI